MAGQPKVTIVTKGNGRVITYGELMIQRDRLRELCKDMAIRLNQEADLMGTRNDAERQAFRRYARELESGADLTNWRFGL